MTDFVFPSFNKCQVYDTVFYSHFAEVRVSSSLSYGLLNLVNTSISFNIQMLSFKMGYFMIKIESYRNLCVANLHHGLVYNDCQYYYWIRNTGEWNL